MMQNFDMKRYLAEIALEINNLCTTLEGGYYSRKYGIYKFPQTIESVG